MVAFVLSSIPEWSCARKPLDEAAAMEGAVIALEALPARLRAARGSCAEMAKVLAEWEVERARLGQASAARSDGSGFEQRGGAAVDEMVTAFDEMKLELERCGTDEAFRSVVER